MSHSVPFKIDIFLGFAEVNGILSFSNNEIKFEFVNSDAFVGLIKSEIHEVIVPIEQIVDISLDKRVWNCVLHIRTSTIKSIDIIPNTTSGEVYCVINEKYFNDATNIVLSVKGALKR